jgi:hypothetical protein
MNKYFKKITYTEDTLKKEYQKLAKKHHPDGGGKQEDFVAMTKERDSIENNIKTWVYTTSKELSIPTSDAFINHNASWDKDDEWIDILLPIKTQAFIKKIDQKLEPFLSVNLLMIVWFFLIAMTSALADWFVFIQVSSLFISTTWVILTGSKLGYAFYFIMCLPIIIIDPTFVFLPYYGLFWYPMSRIILYLYHEGYFYILHRLIFERSK